MSNATTYKLHLVRRERGAVELREGPAPEPPAPAATPARVGRLVALAHHVEGLIRSGAVRDYAQAAELAGITRARVSQIANLLLLAPDIQERLLFMERPAVGRQAITEGDLRPIALEPDWAKQRAMFDSLSGRAAASSSK